MTKSPEPKLEVTSGALGTETPQARVMQLVSLAHKLCDEGRAPEAEDLARSLIGQAPNMPSAQVVLARARGQQGQLEQARSMLEQVVARNPAFFAAHRWLAEVLVAIGDYPRASEVLLRAEAISPGQPRVAELVRQVMGPPRDLPPARPGVPAPGPPRPPPLPRRRQTWEGPAVTEASPLLETLVPPPPPATRVTATRPRTAGPAQPGWNYAPPPGTSAVRTTLPPQQRRFPALASRVLGWTRRHPTAVLTVAGVTLFTLAALTVVLTSWALRRSGASRVIQTAAPGEPPGPVPRLEIEEDSPAPLGAAGFDELLAVLIKDRRLRAPRPTPSVNRALLATALLASEYGRIIDRPTEVWADDLVAGLGSQPPPEDLAAAHVLLRVARGDRAGAEAAARALGLPGGRSPLIRFVEARRLSRNGDGAGALERLGPQAVTSPLPLGRLLLGELALDSGDPDRALAVARGVLADSPRHPLALQLLMEAQQFKGGNLPAEEAALVARACKEDETRISSLAAACHLDRALALRLAGNRRGSLNEALAASNLVPAEPRLLSLTSLALANLGAVREANLVLARVEVLADPSLPLLAWARTGVELASNRLAQLPGSLPPGPEARLVAARSAFAGRPAPPEVSALMETLGKAAAGDRDLLFMTRGAGARGVDAAVNLALQMRERHGLVPPGPVAAYVGGTLARRGGLRPLARLWLARALGGHGDACRAATLFRLALRDVGRSPLQNPRLQRALGRLGCDRLK
jgi:hypothetical protein